MELLPIFADNPAAYHLAIVFMAIAAMCQTVHTVLGSFDDETPTYRPQNLRLKSFFYSIILWLIVATIAAKLKML